MSRKKTTMEEMLLEYNKTQDKTQKVLDERKKLEERMNKLKKEHAGRSYMQ